MGTKSDSAVLKRSSSTGGYVVAVPSNVRKATGLREGDAVVFTVTPDGRTIMRPKTGSLRDLRGVAPTKIHATDKTIRDARTGSIKATPSRTKRGEVRTLVDSRPKKR